MDVLTTGELSFTPHPVKTCFVWLGVLPLIQLLILHVGVHVDCGDTTQCFNCAAKV